MSLFLPAILMGLAILAAADDLSRQQHCSSHAVGVSSRRYSLGTAMLQTTQQTSKLVGSFEDIGREPSEYADLADEDPDSDLSFLEAVHRMNHSTAERCVKQTRALQAQCIPCRLFNPNRPCKRDATVISSMVFTPWHLCGENGECGAGRGTSICRRKFRRGQGRQQSCYVYNNGKFLPHAAPDGHCLSLPMKAYAEHNMGANWRNKADFAAAYKWSMDQRASWGDRPTSILACNDTSFCKDQGKASGELGACECACTAEAVRSGHSDRCTTIPRSMCTASDYCSGNGVAVLAGSASFSQRRAQVIETSDTGVNAGTECRDECWGELRGLATDEGGSLGGKVTTASPEDCKASCDRNSACKSFTMCPRLGGCWLKDRAFGGNESTHQRGDCKTFYRMSCGEGSTPAPATTTLGAPTVAATPAPGSSADQVACSCSCKNGYSGARCEIPPQQTCSALQDCNGRGFASGTQPKCTCDCVCWHDEKCGSVH